MSKESFFQVPWINTAKLSILADRMKMSALPPTITSTRTTQSDYNNNSIVITGYEFAQLSGQKIENIGAQMQLAMLDESVHVNVKYNHPSAGSNQWSGLISWDLLKKQIIKTPVFSTLKLDATMANINSFQGLQLMASTNIPRSGSGYSIINNAGFETLPSGQVTKELHGAIGFMKDRLLFDVRYYHNITTGLSNGTLPTDPTTGLSTQTNYSKILNEGVELFIVTKLLTKKFGWTMTVNGAYNVNKAIDVPTVSFSASKSYLTAYRTDYATDNLWSFQWLGLDNTGNPIGDLDNTTVVYSGRTRAPITGALIQDWNYGGFFASARLIFNLGHVMRRYIPVISGQLDKNYLIAQRWREPGDEAHTDIAVMAATSTSKTLLAQNSTNSILPADNIRLREVQIGYEIPAKYLQSTRLQGVTCALQVQNLALWKQNKYGIDPQTVSASGIVGTPVTTQYVFSLNVDF